MTITGMLMALLTMLVSSLVYAGQEPQRVHFVDVTSESGIDFVHTIGDSSVSNIIETTGAGAAFLDYDRDGDQDLYVVNAAYHPRINSGPQPQQQPSNRLFRNEGDGQFADVTAAAGLQDEDYGLGCAAADYDNDGDTDLFVANYGSNVLYRNNGDGTFSDVTKAAKVAGNAMSVSAVFFDHDRDGWVDLYVGNYLEYDPRIRDPLAEGGFPGPHAYKGQPDGLYRNNRDGTFKDVTIEAGLACDPAGRAMGVGVCDCDNDGDLDLFVCNDAMANFFFRNQGNGKFREEGLLTGFAYGEHGNSTASMHPTFGDFNGDGFLDVFVADMMSSCLYRNERGIEFLDVSAFAGVARASTGVVGWGGGFLDYDNDGDQDLFVANGAIDRAVGQRDLLFANDGRGRMLNVSPHSGEYFLTSRTGRGAAFADYDNDGDVDAFIVNLNDKAVLLRNDGGNRRHWLTLETVGTRSNRDGIGARIEVVAAGRAQVTEVRSGSSYLSQNELRVHLGLGKVQSVDSIQIRWPSGRRQTMKNVKADQRLVIREP